MADIIIISKISILFNFVAAEFPKNPSSQPARIHSPDPFLRAGNAVSVLRKSISPENSFRKTESEELALEFRQFLLWRNPTSPATTIPKKENESRGKSKQNAWWRGEGGAEAVP